MKTSKPVRLPFMPFYIDDWAASFTVQQMTVHERYLYIEMLMIQWRDGFVPDDLAIVCRAIRCTVQQMRNAWPNVRMQFEEQQPGKLTNRRLQEHSMDKASRSVKALESANVRWNRITRASDSVSVSASLSQTTEKPDGEDPTRAREVLPPPQIVPPRRKPVADAPSFHAFWERYRKIRDAGRQQMAAQAWISFDCEDRAEQVYECLTSYERSRDVANGTVNNCEVWLRAVFDSGFTARWPPKEKRANIAETAGPRPCWACGQNHPATVECGQAERKAGRG